MPRIAPTDLAELGVEALSTPISLNSIAGLVLFARAYLKPIALLAKLPVLRVLDLSRPESARRAASRAYRARRSTLQDGSRERRALKGLTALQSLDLVRHECHGTPHPSRA